MAIDCSSGQPAKWADLASIGVRVDEDYTPYAHAEFRTLSGKYVWLFDPAAEDACNSVAGHWMEPEDSFEVNDAESTKCDEEALMFVGADDNGGQANDCFCCPLARVVNVSPLQFALPDAGVGGSCFTALDFDNPCGDGETSILNSVLLDFYSTVGERTHRRRNDEVVVDGERILWFSTRLCVDAEQQMKIGLIWMTEDDFPDWEPPPGVNGTYVLRRIEIDLAGKLVFKIQKEDMSRLRDKVEDYLGQRCAASDERWLNKDDEYILEGCTVTFPELVCTLRGEDELEENAGCIDCDDTGEDLAVLEPWEENTCGAEYACDDKLRLYCETLVQWEKILDELDGDDIKEDDGSSENGCQVCCGGLRQDGLLEMRFHFNHGCDCAQFSVSYSPCNNADGTDCDSSQEFGDIDMNGSGDIYDSLTGWKEINFFRRQYIKFSFSCNSGCTVEEDGWDGCHEGASAVFRVDGVEVAGVSLTVTTSDEPVVDVCELFDPAP